MDLEIETKIKSALKGVKAWQRVPTSLDGIFLVKTPWKSGNESVMVEINPKDEMGNPIKRRGLFLKSRSELKKFSIAMDDEKLNDILRVLERISGINNSEKIKTIEI